MTPNNLELSLSLLRRGFPLKNLRDIPNSTSSRVNFPELSNPTHSITNSINPPDQESSANRMHLLDSSRREQIHLLSKSNFKFHETIHKFWTTAIPNRMSLELKSNRVTTSTWLDTVYKGSENLYKKFEYIVKMNEKVEKKIKEFETLKTLKERFQNISINKRSDEVWQPSSNEEPGSSSKTMFVRIIECIEDMWRNVIK